MIIEKLTDIRKFLISDPILYYVFFICLVLLRTTYAVVMGQGVSTSDSNSYFELEVWGNLRLYTVPILYKVLQETPLIIIFQIFFSSATWAFFAKSLVSKLVLSDGKKILVCFGIFSLASTTPVFVNDFFLMSESISLSLTLLLLATTLNFMLRSNKNELLWLIFVYLAWLYSKQAHVLIFIPTLLLLGILIIRGGSTIRLKYRQFAISFLSLGSIIAVLQVRVENPIANWNTFAVLSMRLVKNPSWIEYFYVNGLPTNFIKRAIDGSIDISTSLSVPAVTSWIDISGVSVYLNFLISNPIYTFLGAIFLPLIGGANYYWSETFPAALFYSFKYFTYNVPRLPDNFSIWWFETPREVIRNLALYTLLLFEGLYRMYLTKSSLNTYLKLSTVNKKLLVASFGLIFWVFSSGSIQWLFAPGDPTRIFLEQAVVVKLALIILACAIWFPTFSSSENLKHSKGM